jgi:hypothetical protein
LGHAYNFVAELNEKNFVDDEDPASQLYPITFEADVIEWDETESEQTVSFKVSNENELKQAFATGGNYYLGEDVVLESSLVTTTDVVLNLNGKSLKCKTSDVLVCEAGTLTINGEGLVYGSEDNSSSSSAVWAKGTGNVIINGGTYKVGDDLASYNAAEDKSKANWRNDCIYARDNAKITIITAIIKLEAVILNTLLFKKDKHNVNIFLIDKFFLSILIFLS